MPCTTMMESKKPVSRAKALLSKENRGGVEAGEPSFRVYYGEKGATVPFMWESQPGTPKHPIFNQSNDNIVPPLTPPPSYNSSSSSSSATAASSWRNRRPRVFSAFLSSFSPRSCSHVNPSPTSSSSSYSGPLSWSTSSSGSSSLSLSSPNYTERKKPMAQRRSHLLCSTPRANKFSLFDDDDQKDVGGSPPTSMCFGFKKQGCYSMKA